MKHGLNAKDVVCAEESSRDYAEFAATLNADFAPADRVEEQLVDSHRDLHLAFPADGVH